MFGATTGTETGAGWHAAMSSTSSTRGMDDARRASTWNWSDVAMVALRKRVSNYREATAEAIAPSSSGRTADFESVRRGSNPRGATTLPTSRGTIRRPRGDVVKWFNTEVCKTSIHRFESGRRLHFPGAVVDAHAHLTGRRPLSASRRIGLARVLGDRCHRVCASSSVRPATNLVQLSPGTTYDERRLPNTRHSSVRREMVRLSRTPVAPVLSAAIVGGLRWMAVPKRALA